MADVLTTMPHPDHTRGFVPGWWPVDYLVSGYLLAGAVLITAYARQLPDAAALLIAHVIGLALVFAAVRLRAGLAPAPRRVFRYWYPLLYVSLCYKEMSLLIAGIRKADLDALMARLDYRIWHAHPTVWLERVHMPWLTELLQVAYTFFVPCVLLVAAVLWVQRRYPDFRYYAFVVSLGFLASYIGYFVVPVRGPRFFLAHLQHIDLHGTWLFDPMQRLLDRLESAHYDCFPSGHTELTLIAWWNSRRISMKLFGAYCVYSILIVFATIYLRYHYTVDVLAGAVLATLVLTAAPRLYAALGGRRKTGSAPIPTESRLREDV